MSEPSGTNPHSLPVCVLAKVGEAALKGRNRRQFFDALRANLRATLQGLEVRIESGGSVVMIAVPDETVAEQVAGRLDRVFGFAAGSICLRCERDAEAIAQAALPAIVRLKPSSFAVRVRRRDKTFPLTSNELEREIGTAVQRRVDLPVDLSAPDLKLRVEVDSDAAFLHIAEIEGAGGLPVGTSGHALSLLSGGIDSPVASLLALKRGLRLDFIHFSGEPYLEPTATTKASAQARVLNGFQARQPGTLWVIPFGSQQRTISAVTPEASRIVLYRRQMLRIACELARRLDATALVTGDSLGQVSSQTLANMTLTEDAGELPVLRPLLAWDKREVMARAASLGILALSEMAADDACPLFAGGKQRTAVPRAEALESESKLDLEGMSAEAAATARRVEPGVYLERLEPESRAA